MQCNVTILHDGNDVSAYNPLERSKLLDALRPGLNKS